MVKSSNKVRCLFGTDGVRDVANRGSMTPEMVMCLGRAFVFFLIDRGIPCPKIAIGMDTRKSGPMLESALVAGMTSAGAQVSLLGVFPTPAVSYITKTGDFDAGAVLSASHNPAEYNGVKFLDTNGFKLSDEDEIAIEDYIGDNLLDEWRPTGASIGVIDKGDGHREQYLEWLKKQLHPLLTTGWNLVIDGANGAASELLEDLFADWEGNVYFCGIKPDGLNINDGVGVMHMKHLSDTVLKHGADLGIAFDGDADRVLLCDSKGRLIDGDLMLWVIGSWFAQENRLGTGVVATVMSNMILEEKLTEKGIPFFRSIVGDRYVLEMMKSQNCLLGGEQSGHIIATDYVNTGDGLCTGLLFLRACKELKEDVHTLNDRFVRYPQLLKNVALKDRDKILSHPEMTAMVEEAEKRLKGKGRLLLRPSGTEPLLRVMVETRSHDLMEEVCNYLVDGIHRLNKEG